LLVFVFLNFLNFFSSIVLEVSIGVLSISKSAIWFPTCLL
jgi:hypothetical protein